MRSIGSTLRFIFVFPVLLLILPFSGMCQSQGKGVFKGKIIDATTSQPLGFASISVFQTVDEKLVNGTITDENGFFEMELAFGAFYAEIDFVGYQPQRIAPFQLSKEQKVLDLGAMTLQTTANELDEVVVQAERSSMELSLDKKIFNVGKDLANAGGSATEILANIPSVSVDQEGNVKLRGSNNVRILIDGKPSGLVSIKGGSGLQQLQASMVERVEIITNPSARYEAEGTAGIINIVLKKDTRQGLNGSFELITGVPENFGVAANLNFRHKKINFFMNYSGAYRRQPGVGKLYQEVFERDTTFILRQRNEGNLRGLNNSIRGGLDYFFNEKSILTAAYLYRRSDANRITDIRYEDFIGNASDFYKLTLRRQDEDEIEPNGEYSVIYKRTFENKNHALLAEVKYIDYWENSDQLFTQSEFGPDDLNTPTKSIVQKSLNDEFEKQWLFQLDYTKPIGKEGKFETGVRSSFRDMTNDFIVTEQDDNGVFNALPGLDNIFLYDENIHAAYGIVGNKSGIFSYQFGLRAEWTDVKTTLKETNEVNPRKYGNLFPSVHITFDLPKNNGIQLSYSRRVRRPFYNDLSPYVTYSDSRNFFSGNPDLNPEFTNAYEMGYLKYFEKGSLSAGIYYRDTEGLIDRIRTVDEEGNSNTRTENLKGEQAYGVEFTSSYTPFSWWKLDVNFNFFHSDIDGSNIFEDYKAETYSWFARQTSRFTLPKKLDIQLRGNYEAPQKTAQGERQALYYLDFSLSKEIIEKRSTINFTILDVFNTRRNRYTTAGENFFTRGDYQFRRRQFNLTFTYRLKKSG